MALVPATALHAKVLAGMHYVCFAKPWSADSFVTLLDMPGTAGLLAVEGDSLVPRAGGSGPAGLVLWRSIAGEAEILTIAVLPPWRKRGLGKRLLSAAMDDSRGTGAEAMFLEVASDNHSALALYEGVGFVRTGLRKAYYGNQDALTMRKDL